MSVGYVRSVELIIFAWINGNKKIVYTQWCTNDGAVDKTPHIGTNAEAVQLLKEKMKLFPLHCYNIFRQHKELSHLKTILAEGEIIVHEVFAENYSIKQQNEIMSAHWSSKQVSIFMAVVYFMHESSLQHLSYAIVSDDVTHDKGNVHSSNSAILQDIKGRLPFPIKMIHYWSDGAAYQFKTFYTLGNLIYHFTDFGCSSDWSFIETAHGKGPVDGIGAEVKRSV